MLRRLQPYRVEAPDGSADGLLTAYYEPLVDAARQPGNGYTVPLYRLPAGYGARKPWYTRQQIDTLPEAQAAKLREYLLRGGFLIALLQRRAGEVAMVSRGRPLFQADFGAAYLLVEIGLAHWVAEFARRGDRVAEDAVVLVGRTLSDIAAGNILG